MASAASRVGPIAERLLSNEYAQENIREGVENLRAAYRRASKRRVKPAEDRRVREQVRRGAASLAEAASALKTGRQKPKRRRGRAVLLLVGVAGVGTAAALASSEELRAKLFGQPADGPAGEAASGPAVDTPPPSER